MNIENYIESQYRELLSCSQINAEYSDLYKSFRNQKLREILMTLHHDLVGLFRTMNERLPTGEHEAHFWAEPSRDLIKRIEIIYGNIVPSVCPDIAVKSFHDSWRLPKKPPYRKAEYPQASGQRLLHDAEYLLWGV